MDNRHINREDWRDNKNTNTPSTSEENLKDMGMNNKIYRTTTKLIESTKQKLQDAASLKPKSVRMAEQRNKKIKTPKTRMELQEDTTTARCDTICKCTINISGDVTGNYCEFKCTTCGCEVNNKLQGFIREQQVKQDHRELKDIERQRKDAENQDINPYTEEENYDTNNEKSDTEQEKEDKQQRRNGTKRSQKEETTDITETIERMTLRSASRSPKNKRKTRADTKQQKKTNH
jgi:hypothetical protein